MTGYSTEYDFYRALPGLIEGGASLQDLYRALLRVKQEDSHGPRDATPQHLRALATHWTQWPSFVPLRLRELFGEYTVAHTDDYVLAMVGALGDRHEATVRPFMLRHDHALREQVFWRIFEVEGGGEISLANVDKFSADAAGWHRTVLALVADGTLDRMRVLRCCLQALNRDFSAYRAGWFSRLYTALAPSPQAAAADQDLLRLCLGAPLTASVSLAATHLAAVHKAGLLEAVAFVQACAPALAGPKAAALAVLRVLLALWVQKAADAAAVGTTIALATAHPHADVQRAAVAALLKLGRDDLACQHRAALAPAVAAELLPTLPDAANGAADAVFPLPRAEPVHPWTDADARERCAVLLEDASDAVEFELALAWLANAAAPGTVLAPLQKRSRKLAQHGGSYLAALLVAACDASFAFFPQRFRQPSSVSIAGDKRVDKPGEPGPWPMEEDVSPLPGFVARLREVAAILQGHAPRRVLLATPTDSHGWIAPAVFLDRFRAGQHQEATALPADLAQALLRLHPEGRPAVLDVLGLTPPAVTMRLRIVWQARSSDEIRASDGLPQWVWWYPTIEATPEARASAANPGLIPSSAEEFPSEFFQVALLTGQLALVHPPSTWPLVAACANRLNAATQEATPVGEEHALRALGRQPGTWTPETVQLVALGMAAKRAEVRAQACELLCAAVPARMDVAAAAEGFAACAPAILLTRWAQSFLDAAAIAPRTTIGLLTGLLPRLEPSRAGVGALLTVLLDESVRLGRGVSSPDLLAWLRGFSGSSAAAKAARALLGMEAGSTDDKTGGRG